MVPLPSQRPHGFRLSMTVGRTLQHLILTHTSHLTLGFIRLFYHPGTISSNPGADERVIREPCCCAAA